MNCLCFLWAFSAACAFFLVRGGRADFFFSLSDVPACGLIRISPNAGGDVAFGFCCSPVMFLDLFYTSALDYQSVNSIVFAPDLIALTYFEEHTLDKFFLQDIAFEFWAGRMERQGRNKVTVRNRLTPHTLPQPQRSTAHQGTDRCRAVAAGVILHRRFSLPQS